VPEQTRLTQPDELVLYTIGHSTRSIDELAEPLTTNRVRRLFDVRRYPSSQRHPQFNEGNLEDSLPERGIAYTHLEALGGYRDLDDPAQNAGWDSDGFQAYANRANNSDEWQQAFEHVLETARELREQDPPGHACVMCAEIVPFACHRRVVADHAVARGVKVLHVVKDGKMREHELTPWGQVEGDGVVYLSDGDA
jgi:uncharacterized protein (DUF488 family)